MKKDRFIAIGISLFVIFIYALPYFILRQNVILSAWDNLDSYLVWYKVIADHGYWLPLDYVIPNFYEGIPRNCFHSELIFHVAIFNFLTPLKAYITVDLLSRFIGFLGMYLLLKDFALKKRNEYFLSGCALCFALIPNLLTLTFLTMLGQPLLLWAFLNIRKGNYKFYNWLVLLLMPCCVNFELVTPFFLTCIGALFLYDCIKNKKINWGFFFAIAFFSFISIITIYRFIYLNFFSDFVGHRKDWSIYQINIKLLKDFWPSIAYGIQTHILRDSLDCTQTLTMLYVLPIAIFSTIYGIYKKTNAKAILSLWALLLTFSTIYAMFFHYLPVIKFTDAHEIIKTFQFNRFYFLIPFVWYVLFAYSLDVIRANFTKFGKYIIILVIILQVGHLLKSNPYFYNSILYMNNIRTDYTTFKEYYATEQFKEIKEFIGKPQNSYKIATIAMPFNIASYNGFYTLSGYFNLYPLEYKRKFEKLSQNAIQTHENLVIPLKYWGHQLVLLPSEYMFDVEQLKQLGCQYIFSHESILLKPDSKLELLKNFKGNSVYNIYVYKVK